MFIRLTLAMSDSPVSTVNAALFENPFGQSDMRAAYRSCVLIDDAYKLWASSIKVYSAPIVHDKEWQVDPDKHG